MDISNWITLALVVVAGIAGWFIAHSTHTTPDVQPFPGEDPILTEIRRGEAEAQTALAEAQTVASVALSGAQMAEQLYNSKKITRDQRSEMALSYITARLAQFGIKISNDQLVKDLESAVYLVNVGSSYVKLAQQGTLVPSLDTINDAANIISNITSSTPPTGTVIASSS